MISLRLGADGLLFHGRYRLIGPAALIDECSRRGFGISVQVRSPSRARVWYPCRREHSLLCRRNDGSDFPHPRLKIVSTAAGCPCGANRPDAARLTDGPANFAPGWVSPDSSDQPPPETFSGSMRDRKSRAHARIMSYSSKCAELLIEGLNGGAR